MQFQVTLRFLVLALLSLLLASMIALLDYEVNTVLDLAGNFDALIVLGIPIGALILSLYALHSSRHRKSFALVLVAGSCLGGWILWTVGSQATTPQAQLLNLVLLSCTVAVSLATSVALVAGSGRLLLDRDRI